LSDTYKDLMEKKKDFYDEIRRKLGEINWTNYNKASSPFPNLLTLLIQRLFYNY
jgi:hypothetical protein